MANEIREELTWLPPRDRWAAIADELNLSETRRLEGETEIEHQLALLIDRRRALITAAVTGQLEVA